MPLYCAVYRQVPSPRELEQELHVPDVLKVREDEFEPQLLILVGVGEHCCATIRAGNTKNINPTKRLKENPRFFIIKI
jgi:hypothetical protein